MTGKIITEWKGVGEGGEEGECEWEGTSRGRGGVVRKGMKGGRSGGREEGIRMEDGEKGRVEKRLVDRG